MFARSQCQIFLALTIAHLTMACWESEDTKTFSLESFSETEATLIAENGAKIIFVDTGSSIAILEIIPPDETSAVAPVLDEDTPAPRDVFEALADPGVALPEFLMARHADIPMDFGLGENHDFRGSDLYGFLSNCWNFDPGEWSSFIEMAYPGYDSYSHVENYRSNTWRSTNASSRRFNASMCTVRETDTGNGGTVDVPYRGWKQAPGGSLVKVYDVALAMGYRLRHWDDPGADGYLWIGETLPDVASGCSFICNDGEVHLSVMWDNN